MNLYLIDAFAKLGKSQKEVIEDLGKSQPYVSALMSGKKIVGKDIAKELADLYGFDEGSILTGKMLNIPNSEEEDNFEDEQKNYLQSERNKYNISLSDISEKTQIPLSKLKQYEDNKKISNKHLNILEQFFENLENQQYSHNDISEYEEPENGKYIPLLPLSAVGGSLYGFSGSINNYDCEKIISPINNGELAITITGDSMHPEYPNGSQVIIKKINERAFIDWGNVFVLDTCNGVIIKKVLPSENTNKIKCESINAKYPSFEVNLSDIYGFYKVLLCLSRK
ncbi:LexA family transcriptional regulator [Capnocytophaga catalasegens]|nr:LexA family transcriptional regulator [Capnocytophaga catalasegens]